MEFHTSNLTDIPQYKIASKISISILMYNQIKSRNCRLDGLHKKTRFLLLTIWLRYNFFIWKQRNNIHDHSFATYGRNFLILISLNNFTLKIWWTPWSVFQLDEIIRIDLLFLYTKAFVTNAQAAFRQLLIMKIVILLVNFPHFRAI